MSAAAFFDAARAYKRELTGDPNARLTQQDVDALNAATSGRWKPEAPKPATSGKGPLVAIVGAIAATSLLASIPRDEGMKLAAYRDVVGIPTICAGDTKNVRMGMVETPEGCQRRLDAQLAAHAAPVMDCTPRLKESGRDWQRAAAVSLAYNIGVRAYCHSTVDRRFDGGDWRGGCNAFLAWNKAGGRVIAGLAARRERERQVCLRGIG